MNEGYAVEKQVWDYFPVRKGSSQDPLNFKGVFLSMPRRSHDTNGSTA